MRTLEPPQAGCFLCQRATSGAPLPRARCPVCGRHVVPLSERPTEPPPPPASVTARTSALPPEPRAHPLYRPQHRRCSPTAPTIPVLAPPPEDEPS